MLVFGKFGVDHRCLTRTKIKVRLWLSFSDHTKHYWACCISDLCLGTNFIYFTVCIAVLQKSCYRHYSCGILISGWLWKQSSLLPMLLLLHGIRVRNYNTVLACELTHFMPLVSFDTPGKPQKTSGFLMFSGIIERDQLH